ncbi:MAG TPA: hypothetical protein VG734_06910 [Lacunisphaera sp.]|nr:hypothetical protein [Lacunisphaera sp.]
MRTWLTLGMIPIAAFLMTAALMAWLKGARLEERHQALLRSQGELRQLRSEHTRLEARQVEVEARRRRAAAPATVAPSEIRRTEEPSTGPAFVVGEWTPSSAWRNEGRGTARAMVSTLLWAAAGGDLSVWRETLEFDDASQRRAQELFAGVPPAVRAQYASAEDLVASVAMTRVPVTEAQLMWLRETDADHAIAGLRLGNATGLAAAAPPPAEVAPNPPPQSPETGIERLVVLNLHRTATGWRVLVPTGAIDRMATELKTPVAKL